MKRIFIGGVLLTAMAFITGCPLSGPKTPRLMKSVLIDSESVTTEFENNLWIYRCAIRGQTFSPRTTAQLKNEASTMCTGNVVVPSDDNLRFAMQIRNEVQGQLLSAIDHQYLDFEKDLYKGRSTTNFLFDFLEIGGNLAGNITNGERAKTILHASVAAFVSNRKAYDLRFFQEQTTGILILKMQTSRDRAMKNIVIGRSRPVVEYTLDDALGDAIEYFYSGTLPRALIELQNDTSEQAKEARNQLLYFKNIPLGIPATKAQRDSAVDANNALNQLATIAANGSPAEKTTALGKLQTILEKINNDSSLSAALEAVQETREKRAAANANRANAELLVNDLMDLRRIMPNRIDITHIEKLNTIIIDVTK